MDSPITASILLPRRRRYTLGTRGVYGSRYMSGCHEKISRDNHCPLKYTFTLCWLWLVPLYLPFMGRANYWVEGRVTTARLHSKHGHGTATEPIGISLSWPYAFQPCTVVFLWLFRRDWGQSVRTRRHSLPLSKHPPAHSCVGKWGSCYFQCTCGPLPSSRVVSSLPFWEALVNLPLCYYIRFPQ